MSIKKSSLPPVPDASFDTEGSLWFRELIRAIRRFSTNKRTSPSRQAAKVISNTQLITINVILEGSDFVDSILSHGDEPSHLTVYMVSDNAY
jgi:hypothetical protein